jgi:hypothetical protein
MRLFTSLRWFCVSLALSSSLVVAPAVAQELPSDGPAPPAMYFGLNGYPLSTPKFEFTTKYKHIAWMYGDRARTGVWVTGFSCRAGHCLDAVFGEAVMEVTRASAKVRTADALWRKYVTVNCSKPQADPLNADMCNDRAAWIERNRKVWAEETSWWVGK